VQKYIYLDLFQTSVDLFNKTYQQCRLTAVFLILKIAKSNDRSVPRI